MQMRALLQPLLGILVLVGLTWACSEARRKICWRSVLAALAVQLLLAFAALRLPWVRRGLLATADGIGKLKDATASGTSFVFGYVGGGPPPWLEAVPGRTFVFAFQALPMVMVVSALAMLLFHWGILQRVVRVCAWVLRRTLRVGGALGACAAAKIFLGQTEAPLLIRPYVSKLSRSELFSVMTLGMSTTSASVMVLYASILADTLPNAMAHVLTASLISVPGAIALSRLLVPNHGPATDGDVVTPFHFESSMEAIAQGASDGMKLYLNIIAMLIVMLALVALFNSILGVVPWPGPSALSLEHLFGWCLAPLAWLMGIPWHEAAVAGHLIGTKLALNEVMAFVRMAAEPADSLSGHSRTILTYALCGFANLSSVGIQIAGLGTMAPDRRSEITALAFRALIIGTAASCLSGTLVGLLTP